MAGLKNIWLLSFFQLSVRASDQRIPERVDDSVVVIDILRDQFPPVFQNEPYGVAITDNQVANISIYQVSGFDQDRRVSSIMLLFLV